MSMNLHDIVRGAIQTVNTDVPGTVYVNTGQQNVRGILTPTFTAVAAQLQVQARNHDALRHEDNVNRSRLVSTVYAYGNFAGVVRPDGTGGDAVFFGGQWYYITQVLEWWPGWCCFEVTRQLNAATVQQWIDAIRNGENP